MLEPKRTVRVHFNRLNMQAGKPNVWTVHTSKACIQVEKIIINTTLHTVYNPKGRQPRAYFKGLARVRVEGSTAILF